MPNKSEGIREILDKLENYALDHYERNILWRIYLHLVELPAFIQYLFSKADNPEFCSWWERLKCRIKHHPCGSIYYTDSSKYEPDDRCKNCGDEL